ncbi:hypothetical protein EVAR_52499_1 [Eumeta japonica]|uniref:Uncharacterized protein n=1 Tax=Eumeta variegata TaxID=151549 RepID=A0A4C1ZR62_EUMVA|nr:hypothetical protein EVAR_52499_1 [Eumeta japonica]
MLRKQQLPQNSVDLRLSRKLEDTFPAYHSLTRGESASVHENLVPHLLPQRGTRNQGSPEGSPEEIPVDEVRRPPLPKPPGSIGSPITEPLPRTLDLVLVSGTAEANDKATKAAFFKIRSVCSLSGVKAEQPANAPYPGSVITASPTGIRPATAFIQRVALSAWATTAQRNAQ